MALLCTALCDQHNAHLVSLLELGNLTKHVLQYVLGGLMFGWQVVREAKDLTTLTHVVLQVVIRACTG